MKEYEKLNDIISCLKSGKERRGTSIVIDHTIFDDCISEFEEIKAILEKKETNFERLLNHLWSFRVEHDSDSVSIFKLEFAMLEDFGEIPYHSMNDFILWLKRPYQKPKVKLTKLEYDLIEYCHESDDECNFNNWIYLNAMKEKGHFKGISNDGMTLEEILNNCEIVK